MQNCAPAPLRVRPNWNRHGFICRDWSWSASRHRLFLENAAAEAAGVREESRQRQEQARDASEAVNGAERPEAARATPCSCSPRPAHARNQTMHAEGRFTAWSRMRNGWLQRSALPARELASLGSERGQAWLNSNQSPNNCNASRASSSPCARRPRLARSEETAAKLEGNRLRAEMADPSGRRNSPAVPHPRAQLLHRHRA